MLVKNMQESDERGKKTGSMMVKPQKEVVGGQGVKVKVKSKVTTPKGTST